MMQKIDGKPKSTHQHRNEDLVGYLRVQCLSPGEGDENRDNGSRQQAAAQPVDRAELVHESAAVVVMDS